MSEENATRERRLDALVYPSIVFMDGSIIMKDKGSGPIDGPLVGLRLLALGAASRSSALSPSTRAGLARPTHSPRNV
jgi:hypothetical protein